LVQPPSRKQQQQKQGKSFQKAVKKKIGKFQFDPNYFLSSGSASQRISGSERVDVEGHERSGNTQLAQFFGANKNI